MEYKKSKPSTNLWEETLSILEKHGKDWEKDVEIIQGEGFFLTKEEFEKMARKTFYHSGYGLEEIRHDLTILFFGGREWITRASYDGREWWSFHTFPKKETIHKNLSSLFSEECLKLRGKNGN